MIPYRGFHFHKRILRIRESLIKAWSMTYSLSGHTSSQGLFWTALLPGETPYSTFVECTGDKEGRKLLGRSIQRICIELLIHVFVSLVFSSGQLCPEKMPIEVTLKIQLPVWLRTRVQSQSLSLWPHYFELVARQHFVVKESSRVKVLTACSASKRHKRQS